MNHLLMLRIRARLIAQLSIALVACGCWRLTWWARREFRLTDFHSLGDEIRGGAVFAGTIVMLAIATILAGYILYPLIRRRRGPIVSHYMLPLSVPAIIFGPALPFAVLDFIGLDEARNTLIVYCLGAMLAATASWDFWTAVHDDGSLRAVPAFLWILVGESAVLFLTWFNMYFE